MKKIVFIVIIFISNLSKAQFIREYDMISMINNINNKRVFFFNLLNDKDQIYVGSNLGVFKIEDGKLIKYSDQTGIVELFKSGNKVLFNPPLDYQAKSKDSMFLGLPKYIEKEITSFAYQNDNLFIVSKGILFLFKKTILHKSFEGKSIRSISQNLVGTYTGIYNKNEVLLESFPTYTNSYIREFSNEVFVNYDGLFVKKDKEQGINYRRPLDGSIDLLGNQIGFAENVEKINDSTYFIFTNKGLFVTNFLDFVSPIDTISNSNRSIYETKYIHHFVDDERVLYYKNKTLKAINNTFNDISVLHQFKHPVKNFSFLNNHLFFIDDFGISELFYSQEKRLIKSDIFHTVFAINENNLALLSNQGFYKYNIKNNDIITLNNNEFNSKALEIFGDTIYAGSIDGLYKITINDFLNFQPHTNGNENIDELNSGLIFLIVLCIGLGVFIILRNPRKAIEPNLLDDINTYIEENLATVTVLQIQENFSISYRKLNRISGTISPGKLIETKRKNKVKLLIKKGDNIEEICNQTGYKKEYLKKLNAFKT